MASAAGNPPAPGRSPGGAGETAGEPGRILPWPDPARRPNRRGEGRVGGHADRVPPGPDGPSYADAFRRALDGAVRHKRAVDHERSRAAQRTRELLKQPAGRRALLLDNHPDFGGWWLAELLAAEAERPDARKPEEAVQLARLAAEAADRVEDDEPDRQARTPGGRDAGFGGFGGFACGQPPRSWRATTGPGLADEGSRRRRDVPDSAEPVATAEASPPVPRVGNAQVQSSEARGPADAGSDPLVEDLKARSWRALADAHRRAGDLEAAASALARARRHLRRGTREPLERAALFESTGHLLAAAARRRAATAPGSTTHPRSTTAPRSTPAPPSPSATRAATCYRAAASLFTDLGDDQGAARCHLAHALLPAAAEAAATREQLRRTALELRLGLELLDADAEPELAAAARRRLADLASRDAGPPPGRGPGGRAASRTPRSTASAAESLPVACAGPACGFVGG